MATWTKDSKTGNVTATVRKGDTLSEIAEYARKTYGLSCTYKQLASWNDISNPDIIHVGQTIKCYKPGSSSGSGGSTTKAKPGLVIDKFGLLASDKDEKTLIASWTWDKASETAEYKYEWVYNTGAGIWLTGNSGSNTVDHDNRARSRYSTYTIPGDATNIAFRVKPISTKKKDSKTGKETARWTQNWSPFEYYAPKRKPADVGVPEATPEGYNITFTLKNIEVEATNDNVATTHVVFQLIRNDDAKLVYTTSPIAVHTGVASYIHKCLPDANYKARCRSYNSGSKVYGEWSDYTDNQATPPATPTKITSIKAESSTSVRVHWEVSKTTTATSYYVAYTTDKRNFDGSNPDAVKNITVSGDGTAGSKPPTSAFIDIEAGHEYFFRVRAINDQGTSGWTGIKSIVIGTKPAAPTTWSSTSTVTQGSNVTLYWVHNSTDGSKMTETVLEFTNNDGKQATCTITKDGTITSDAADISELITYVPPEKTDDTETEPTYSCVLKTVNYKAGAAFEWRVKTAGVKMDSNNKPDYGQYSTLRTIDIYEEPSIDFCVGSDMNDINSDMFGILKQYPIYFRASASPNNEYHHAIGYHIRIVAGDTYETIDNLGNSKLVNKGDEVYAKYFNPDANRELLLELTPSDITLEPSVPYDATCVASMSSGLSTSHTLMMTADWELTVPTPNATISIDNESLAATIMPYCGSTFPVYRRVNYDASTGKYSPSTDEDTMYLDYTYGEIKWRNEKRGIPYRIDYSPDEPELLDLAVYVGDDDDGNEVLFCTYSESEDYTDAYLAVYRREYDGRFVEIASELDSAVPTTVTDPHPALDYARYRIVATDKLTGAINYFDTPGYPVDCHAAILQWDEIWNNYDAELTSTPVQSPWSGSMLKLPYNLDVSDSHKPEYTLVEYAGRSHPVSYYGTHLGTTSSWNVVIPKEDTETLYALRRLARWLGDVYVREPSGSGYWAQVTVTFSQTHCDPTIPVSLSITRVEGGI